MDDARSARSSCPLAQRRSLRASAFRATSAALIALLLTLSFTSAGCSAADDSSAWPESVHPSLPASTVEALNECAKEGVGRLSCNNYEIGFRIEITEAGEVKSASTEGKRIEEPGI